MRRPLASAILIGAFIAGAAARGGLPSREPSPPPPPAGDRASAPREAPSAGPSAPDPSPRRLGGPQVAAEPSSEERLAEIARLVAALPAPDVPPAEGILEGIVVDPRGQPLPGMVVRALPVGAPKGARSALQDLLARDFPRYLAGRAAEHRHLHERGREAVSGADGRFRIEGLPAERHQLALRDTNAEFRISVDGVDRELVEPGEEIEVEARIDCAVRVEVRLGDGSLAEAATVYADEVEHEWSAASAVLRLPAGWVEIVATVGDAASPVECHWVHPDRVAPIVLALPEADEERGIALTVHLPAGRPPAELWISWLALAPGEAPSEKRLLENCGDSTRRLEPSEEGPIEESIALPAARYAVGIGRDLDSVEAMALATVGEQWSAVEVTLPPAPDSTAIEVRTIGPDGAPLDEVEISLHAGGEEDSERIEATVSRVATGVRRLEVRPQEVESAAGAPWHIRAGSDELGWRWVAADAPVVEIRFLARASLVVELDGWSATEDTEARLRTGGPEGLDSNGAEGNTLIFPPVQPGVGSLEIWRLGDLLAALDEVRIEQGENRIRVPMPPLSAIDVEIPPDRIEWGFTLVRIDAGVEIGRRWQQGERRGSMIRFEGLLDGEYSLHAHHGPASEVMTIRILGDLRVRFRGKDASAWLVRFRGETPPGADRLRDGDRIVGVEGTEFASSTEMNYLASLFIREDGVWRFLVDRPGAGRIEVEVDVEAVSIAFPYERLPLLIEVSRE